MLCLCGNNSFTGRISIMKKTLVLLLALLLFVLPLSGALASVSLPAG